jgi:hypothetical protein
VIKIGGIIRAQGILYPCCSKTHVIYRFNIDHPLEQLNIAFSYYPKVCEDKEKAKDMIIDALYKFTEEGDRREIVEKWEEYMPIKNLLTISIDDPKGFRGCAHRHPSEQHLFLSEHSASPGFTLGPIFKGEWQITISVHAVVTDECYYTLDVWEGEDYE